MFNILGCGFIGRNLVEYLIENDLVSAVRVVDKVPPQTAWLNKKHQELFNNPKVHFKSANLINPADEDGSSWDYVVNCACETKPGQTDPVYREGILKLSVNCASEAAKINVKRFVEVSTGHMYSTDKNPHKEDGKIEPWTYVAKFKRQVEEELHNIPGLRFTVIRPAIIYGIGDRHGIAPRLVIGAVYKHLGEMMKLLWGKDLKMNTIHVIDLCRAIWFLSLRDDSLSQVYNIADRGDTTQGTISNLVSEIFNINHDYYGSVRLSVYKLDMATLVEEVNDKHLGPWAEACAQSGVENTPLTPYIDQELLYNKHLYLDYSKLESTGFTWEVPHITRDRLKEVRILVPNLKTILDTINFISKWT
ncbi:hypothetical protein C0J52_17192 [Blattella germanica]|nr:hypothetical protein C0J52_17192 [Blattella germanica]